MSMSGTQAPAEPGDGGVRDMAYRWLKSHIGTLPRDVGSFLTEATVCEATGASRTPVREAFLRLEAEGLLQILPKKGAFIPPISDSEIEAVMQARLVVEDWCIRRLASSPALSIAELERLVRVQADALEDRVAFIESDREFHRHIVRAAGNVVFDGLYERLRERQLRMGVLAIAGSEDRGRQVLREHGAVVAALSANDVSGATEALHVHLRSTLATLQRFGRRPLGSVVDADASLLEPDL